MKNDEKLVRVMVKQGVAKVDEVEGGCWLWSLGLLLEYLLCLKRVCLPKTMQQDTFS